MASMISGDFAEAYVRKNACKKETGMAEANAAAVDGSSAAQGEKKAGDGASGKKTTTGEAGVKGDGGLFGLIKKKVHPKAGGRGASSSSS